MAAASSTDGTMTPIEVGDSTPREFAAAVASRKALFHAVDETPTRKPGKKVTVVGAGQVGVATAYTIVSQGLCSELALVDIAHDKVVGEALDLQHGAAFAKHITVTGSSSYEISSDSDVVVITAGVRQRQGESRLDLVGRNLAVLRAIVPEVVKYSPHCTIVVVSNPCDIMTYLVHKLSGFHVGRVLGSGTALDSSRFRSIIGQRLGVSPSSVHGYIVGEHGDSSVACWSQLNVGGVPLKAQIPEIGTKSDPEEWYKVHEEVIGAAGTVIRLKGYTNLAIGLTGASIVESILRNDRRVIPVSTSVKGLYGIEEEVFLSVPCVVGSNGVRDVCAIPLDDTETAKLRASAKAIAAVQTPLEI